MPTETYYLLPDRLLGAGLDFCVAEGPFKSQSDAIIDYADKIVLHLKNPPLSMGGGWHGKSKVSIQFWNGDQIFYRAVLGRFSRSEIFTSEPKGRWLIEKSAYVNHDNIMVQWCNVEHQKTYALAKQLNIHKVTVVQKSASETVIKYVEVDHFDEMTDLEVLERLNSRSRAELEKMRAVSIAGYNQKQDQAMPVTTRKVA